jgi:hypothetical protein
MTPSQAGARAEAAVLAALVASGRPVLIPFASHLRYDLVFEDDQGFQRVQCKVGRLVKGAVRFRTHSTTGGKLKGYGEGSTSFVSHCAETNNVCSSRQKASCSVEHTCASIFRAMDSGRPFDG